MGKLRLVALDGSAEPLLGISLACLGDFEHGILVVNKAAVQEAQGIVPSLC